MWRFFIDNSRFAYLILLALIAAGLFSVVSISRESSPEVIVPIGVVSTVLPGAPAADVEALVTNEIERGLTGLDNVKKITSQSRESVSSVTVEFEADANLSESIQELKDEVDTIVVELPTDAEDPQVLEVNFTDQPVLTTSLSGELSDYAFTLLQNELENELESISGVSRVEFSGVRDQEVSIVVSPEALANYNVSLSEVINAISAANQTFPIGQIENDGVTYNIAFEGDIRTSEDIKLIAIANRGGQPVYVRDVATIIDGLSPASTFSRLSINNEPSKQAVTLDVYKQSGGDITKITQAVNDKLIELKQPGGLLEGLDTLAVLDAGDQINQDLLRLSGSGLQTVLLVVVLLMITLGWREGLLAGLAIPLSFLIGFIGLYFSGNTINFLSLFSLILGVGILVDSAIVMVEGMNRKLKDNPDIDKKMAAIETIAEFKAPLISGTLTTVSMFAGLFIVSGVIGQFIASIPFTLIFLLFASMFVSLAIIPLLAALFLRRRSDTRAEQLQIEYAHKLENWYKKKLRAILESTKKEWIFLWSIRFALFLALLMPVLGVVKVVFFETGDNEYVVIEIEEPEGTVKEVTDVAVRRVEEVLYSEDTIESFVVTVGAGNSFTSGGSGGKLANIFITLRDDREESSLMIIERLREQLAPINDVTIKVDQLSDGPPTGAAIIVKFLGDDLAELTELLNETTLLADSIPEITNIETSTNDNNTEFVLELDRYTAASYGISASEISSLARTAVFGSDATSISTLTSDIDVVVKLSIDPLAEVNETTTNIATIDEVARLPIGLPDGTTVPLGDLVTISLRESSTVINHEENKRVVSLTADVTEGGNAREAQAALLSAIKEAELIPDSVTLSSGGGETDESNQAFIEMFVALIVGVILMIGVLTLQFNSYLHTRYVLSILPFSLIGIMTGLALTDSPLSFPSIMGFIALSGIVVNNSILLIDMMNQMRKRQPERNITEVILEAAASRLRPILLTTLTTVCGMIPLLSAGDLWVPLAFAVMFGLVFSVIITLVLIPIIYHRKPGTVNS